LKKKKIKQEEHSKVKQQKYNIMKDNLLQREKIFSNFHF